MTQQGSSAAGTPADSWDDSWDPDIELGSGAPGSTAGFTFGVIVASLAAALLGVGLWAYLQVPAAVALGVPGANMAPAVLDAASGVVAGQLAAASGRTLDVVAGEVSAEEVPTGGQPDTVAGDSAASTDYADTLAALAAAEKAAAEQLAISEQDAKTAQEEQQRAQTELASEEAAAAKEIDNAIAAAIAAAEAQSTAANSIPTANPDAGAGAVTDGSAVTGGTGTATTPDAGAGPADGSAIDTAGVLALVRKYFPAAEVTNAMAVSRCESGHRNAVGAVNGNGTRDYGIFQVNDGGTLQAALRSIGEPYSSITEARQKALNAELNVRMARALWDSRGWQPWVCAAKVKVVSGLYERTPGPMYGKYNEQGLAS